MEKENIQWKRSNEKRRGKIRETEKSKENEGKKKKNAEEEKK